MQISKINIDRYRPKIQKNIQNANKKLLKHNRRKLLPTMVFALMPLSLLSNINNSNTKEQIVKNNPEKYNIEYFNVKNSTKLSIENSLNELIEKSKTVNFLDDININITKNLNKLNDDDNFRFFLKNKTNKYAKNIKGFSYYSDTLRRSVCVQESPHINKTLINNKVNEPALEFTLMHEIGHQFDQYYGHDHNSEIATAWKEIEAKFFQEDSLSVFTYPKDKNDYYVKIEYMKQNCLNDTREFKNAYFKDLLNIIETTKKNKNNKDLAANIYYFIPKSEYLKYPIPKMIDALDSYRSETYANLFAYIVGEDDGNKEKFIKNFENCYNVVKKDIENFIGFE